VVEFPRETTPPPHRSPPRPGDRVERVAIYRGVQVSPPARRVVRPHPAHRMQPIAPQPERAQVVVRREPPAPPPSVPSAHPSAASSSSVRVPATHPVVHPRHEKMKLSCSKCGRHFQTAPPRDKHEVTCTNTHPSRRHVARRAELQGQR